MIQYLLAHPSLLLWAFPFVLAAAVGAVGKAEKAGISYLFSRGDAIDQECARSIVAAVVKWAEKRAAPNADGSSKFAAVDKMLARALPFLTADERRQVIEKCVAEMDQAAQDALAAPAAAPAPKAPPAA